MVARFVTIRCAVATPRDLTTWTLARDVYAAYTRWATADNASPLIGRTTFGWTLKALGFARDWRGGRGARWYGLALR